MRQGACSSVGGGHPGRHGVTPPLTALADKCGQTCGAAGPTGSWPYPYLSLARFSRTGTVVGMEQPASPPPKYDFDRDIELLQQWKATSAKQHSARTTSLETWASAFTAVALVCAVVATVLVTVLR